ncbi:hypothetical protein BHM03_00004834 [Ensete ventricosum]|nr:hypothetical protein BHM03_00004834 [Ensete ventricosum]
MCNVGRSGYRVGEVTRVIWFSALCLSKDQETRLLLIRTRRIYLHCNLIWLWSPFRGCLHSVVLVALLISSVGLPRSHWLAGNEAGTT